MYINLELSVLFFCFFLLFFSFRKRKKGRKELNVNKRSAIPSLKARHTLHGALQAELCPRKYFDSSGSWFISSPTLPMDLKPFILLFLVRRIYFNYLQELLWSMKEILHSLISGSNYLKCRSTASDKKPVRLLGQSRCMKLYHVLIIPEVGWSVVTVTEFCVLL